MIQVSYKIRINAIPNFNLEQSFYFADKNGELNLFETKEQAEKYMRNHFRPDVDSCAVLHHNPNLYAVNA